MYVLGVSEGHGASAALLKDGEIIAAANEERFTRNKGFAGFPEKTIQYLTDYARITPSDIDKVIIPSLHPFSFFMEDENENEKKSIYHRLFSLLLSDGVYWTTAKIGYHYPAVEKLFLQGRHMINTHLVQRRMFSLRCDALSRQLDIPRSRISATSHQFSHALAGYYSYPELAGKPAMVMTADGMGNHHCSTVYSADGSKLTTLANTPNYRSLAFIYGMITKYMGMKFLEHEYKVMGLAPYADPVGVAKTYDVLKKLIWVGDDLQFHTSNSTRVVYFYLEKHLKEHRFDWIAGAAQKLVEDVVQEWVVKAIRKYKIPNIVLGGGLFMNVKANMAVMELPEVEKVYPCPSASDESCAIGACTAGYLYDNGKRVPGRTMAPLSHLYLGTDYTDSQIETVLQEGAPRIRYIRPKNINVKVAELLEQNKVVSRFSGRMEFGPRALGNRSIMANPSFGSTVEIINRQIKNRDFWMPFAATMLEERVSDYIDNPKMIPAPFMIMAFDTTSLGQKHFQAAIHPYDKTIRPQVIDPGTNPDYYEVIKNFEQRTGIGGVLNTSFNLHGEPIVESPADALHTFLDSGLEYMAIGSFLVEKND